MEQIISIPEMEKLVNRDYKTLWVWVKNGNFPKPVRVNGRAIGWTQSSYQKWIDESQTV
ncbi:MAG: helix-turn-helix transcriptional regulator [Trichlorobacter sp.]|uniref:Prophage regulatory protein n=1 Tax=Tolumonas osonensis TaxID=675874 RepID=A0A841G832_9GAMM|nr:AlpA family phage regulatory protein [Tolumonas osonensis]MBB6055274.1 prophage regulatory protein [Tolumonas osonensis]